jgi:hypothetical protein
MTKQNMLPALPKMVTFSLTIEEDEQAKLMAFMSSDSWERAEEVRKASIHECTNSLKHCVMWAQRDCGSSRVFAHFLASLYNGYRVKADVSDIGALDPENFEHLMNVLRLCYMTQREPHTFVDNGSEVFEGIISQWDMETKCNG